MSTRYLWTAIIGDGSSFRAAVKEVVWFFTLSFGHTQLSNLSFPYLNCLESWEQVNFAFLSTIMTECQIHQLACLLHLVCLQPCSIWWLLEQLWERIPSREESSTRIYGEKEPVQTAAVKEMMFCWVRQQPVQTMKERTGEYKYSEFTYLPPSDFSYCSYWSHPTKSQKGKVASWNTHPIE